MLCASNDGTACRGGSGPSPIGLNDLELIIAACIEADISTRSEPHHSDTDLEGFPYTNPFQSPLTRVLRKPLREFLGHYPTRAAHLFRHPRIVSDPRHAWKERFTSLVATKTDRDGERRQIRVPLHAPMRDDDIIQFLYCCPHVREVIFGVLERGGDQPITLHELLRLKHVLTLEYRILKGWDIAWVSPGSEATGKIPAAATLASWLRHTEPF